ncbi:MAG TPA: HAD-IIIA family hydrolase [Gemmatimonadales bacterium]|nr:HAD-IIIA family hydrolase [Gemmatimonadales bacterium]
MSEPLAGWDLVIFDADDTLRFTTIPGQPSPRGSDEWALLPGVAETLSLVPWMRPGGPRLGLASNQDQIGYGYLSERTARRLLKDLALAATGTVPPPPAIQLCPHRLEVACDCRKPAPGMLRRIIAYYGVQPGGTLFVGNSETDRAAAESAGVRYRDAARAFRRSA